MQGVRFTEIVQLSSPYLLPLVPLSSGQVVSGESQEFVAGQQHQKKLNHVPLFLHAVVFICFVSIFVYACSYVNECEGMYVYILID